MLYQAVSASGMLSHMLLAVALWYVVPTLLVAALWDAVPYAIGSMCRALVANTCQSAVIFAPGSSQQWQ